MNRISTIGAAVALSLAAIGQSASAAVLYDNGPIGFVTTAIIAGGQAIGDVFTLSSSATVTGVTFGAWSIGTLNSIDWGITSSFGVVAYNATAAVTEGPVLAGTDGTYEIRKDSFSTGSFSLSAGTYYLWLQNASNPSAGWDDNHGPSASYFAEGGVFGGPIFSHICCGDAESFQILGSVVPEPATWAMMLLGFGGLGAVTRSRRGMTPASA